MFDASKCSIQNFQGHPTKFSCWIGLLLVSSNISFLRVIANVKTSNFEWFNKTKTLCKIIIIKNHTPVHSKSKWSSTATKKILTIYPNYKNMGKNTKMQQKKLKTAGKEKASRPKKVCKGNRKKYKGWGNLSTLAFYLGVTFHLQSLQALTVSLAKACPSSSLIWHWMKELMDLHVGWKMFDDRYKRYKLSSSIPATFIQHFIQYVG